MTDALASDVGTGVGGDTGRWVAGEWKACIAHRLDAQVVDDLAGVVQAA